MSSKLHFYIPLATRGQSLLLALLAGYCTVYFGINTSKQDLCRHSSLEGKSFVRQYLSITYLAESSGSEPHTFRYQPLSRRSQHLADLLSIYGRGLRCRSPYHPWYQPISSRCCEPSQLTLDVTQFLVRTGKLVTKRVEDLLHWIHYKQS